VDVVLDNLGLFASGLALTLVVSVSASLGGSVVGLLAALGRMAPAAPLRWVATGYVELIRNTPGLVQVFLVYLGLPRLGIRFSPLGALVTALTINNGAYIAEIVRGGLQAVPRGQLDAAASLGLSRRLTLREVVLPQTLHAIHPALANQFIQTVLASSIGTVVGVEELTQVALFVESRTYRTVEILAALTIIYVVVTYILAVLMRWLGMRLDRGYR
jgi:His/Glu/Gln/Arg/opine family amino acid ABC transporter permease subunit